MSLPLTTPDWWESGTNQNSVPANNNALRFMVSTRDGVADDVTAQPALTTPADDGKWYIIPAAATGTQWATFAEDSAAIFFGGTWYEFTPVDGDKVSVAGALLIYSGSGGWGPVTLPAAAEWGLITGTLSDQTDLQAALDAKSGTSVSIITEASTSTMDPATHAGSNRYIRAADDVTFNTAESYTAGEVYNIRATSALTLIGTGVTLTAPAGGTLALDAAMSVTVVMTSSSAGDVIGQTVAA